ncbi:hypothetical protein FOCC_FOCC004638, partial [Frankliniella occidentalis]
GPRAGPCGDRRGEHHVSRDEQQVGRAPGRYREHECDGEATHESESEREAGLFLGSVEVISLVTRVAWAAFSHWYLDLLQQEYCSAVGVAHGPGLCAPDSEDRCKSQEAADKDDMSVKLQKVGADGHVDPLIYKGTTEQLEAGKGAPPPVHWHVFWAAGAGK